MLNINESYDADLVLRRRDCFRWLSAKAGVATDGDFAHREQLLASFHTTRLAATKRRARVVALTFP